jgi:hypothetical protein
MWIISKNCLCDVGTLTLLVIDFETPVKFVCLQTPINMNFYSFNAMAFLNPFYAGCSSDWVWREYLCVDSSWKMLGEQQRQNWSSWQITLDSTVPKGTTAVMDLHPPESAPSGGIVSPGIGERWIVKTSYACQWYTTRNVCQARERVKDWEL